MGARRRPWGWSWRREFCKPKVVYLNQYYLSCLRLITLMFGLFDVVLVRKLPSWLGILSAVFL